MAVVESRGSTLLLVCVIVSACGGQAGDRRAGVGADGVSRHDSAGVEIVDVAASAVERPALLRIAPEPLLVLEGAGTTSSRLFSDIFAVFRTPGGTIGVVDRRISAVHLFDTTGRLLRTVGRSGKGPGEFLQIATVVPLPGDSLIVQEWRTSLLSVFGPDGRFVRQVLLAPPPLHQRAHLLSRYPDGGLLAVSPAPEHGPPRLGLVSTRQHVLGYSHDSASGRVLATGLDRELVFRPGGPELVDAARFLRPFGARGNVRAVPDGFLMGDGRMFEVMRYTRDGRLQRSLRVALQGPGLTAALRTAENARMAQIYRGGVLRARFEAFWADAPFPPTAPAFARFEVDAHGRLWIEAYPGEEGERTKWFVFTPDAQPLGCVEMPAGFALHQVVESAVLGVQTRDDGSQVVIVYHLEEG